MNREQMVEKAARVIALVEDGQEWPSNTDLGGHPLLGTRDDEYRAACREEATAVLDAILPQVTTIEELEALPHRSIVVDKDGRPWIKCKYATHWRSPRGTVSAVDLQHFYGRPLTVVWQP